LHVPPLTPHAEDEGVSQLLFEQHPGQFALLQTHAPASVQVCPRSHAGFFPHWQPAVPQLFAVFGSQDAQGCPASPQNGKPVVVQVPLKQQFDPQFVGLQLLHTWLTQVPPAC
jgi:hypothetical protein